MIPIVQTFEVIIIGPSGQTGLSDPMLEMGSLDEGYYFLNKVTGEQENIDQDVYNSILGLWQQYKIHQLL